MARVRASGTSMYMTSGAFIPLLYFENTGILLLVTTAASHGFTCKIKKEIPYECVCMTRK